MTPTTDRLLALVRTMLLARRGEVIDERLAEERARNITTALSFELDALVAARMALELARDALESPDAQRSMIAIESVHLALSVLDEVDHG